MYILLVMIMYASKFFDTGILIAMECFYIVVSLVFIYVKNLITFTFLC